MCPHLVTKATRTQQFFYILAFGVPASWAALFIYAYGYNIPYYDQWTFIELLERFYTHQPIAFSDLAAQHNEHRVLFPRLIMLGLAQFTHWNIRAELLMGYILLLAFAAILLRQIRALYSTGAGFIGNSYVAVGGSVVAMTLVFSLAQQENLLWGWQIQVFLNVLTVTLGFHLLTKHTVLRYPAILGAAACGIVATYSFANGLFFWPIGLVLLSLRARSYPNYMVHLLGWAMLMGLLFFAYLHGYQKPAGNPSLLESLRHPTAYIKYVLTYIGTPLVPTPLAAHLSRAGVGLLATLAGGVLAGVLLRTKSFWRKEVLFWHALLLYALGSVLVTATARSQFGFGQAASSRYVTFGNFFWLWLLLLGLYQLLKNGRPAFGFLLAASGILLGVLGYGNFIIFRQNRGAYAERVRAQQLLIREDVSAPALITIAPRGYPLAKKNAFLKKEKLSFYYQQTAE